MVIGKAEKGRIKLSEKIGQFKIIAETKTGDQIVTSKNAKLLENNRNKELE